MQVFKLQSIIGQYSFQVFHNLYCNAAWATLKINILQSTNPKHHFAKFVRRKNSFNRRFVNFFSAFHFVGSKECCLHTVFFEGEGETNRRFAVSVCCFFSSFAQYFRQSVSYRGVATNGFHEHTHI